MFGSEPSAVCAVDGGGREPRAALEAAILPALLRPPCVVAFSGGRDSCALLAVAVGLARREGIADPIPITLEFADAATIETGWQERALAHLGVEDRVRVAVADELDLVGPVAARGLRRHGLLYPANAHLVVPMARAARGGSLLTGYGGDDVFGSWPWSDVADVLARRRHPRVADLRRGLNFASPAWLRAEIRRRRDVVCSLPWLLAPYRERASLAVARELTSAPRTWVARMAWTACWRTLRVSQRCIARLAADEDAVAAAPFLDPGFLAAVGTTGGRWGWGGRTATMRALFGDLLPETIIARSGKAEFSGPFFGPATRGFSREWNGDAGPATELIDPGVLRSIWSSARPNFLCSSLLQAAWMASDAKQPSGQGAP
ncbi:MAG: asparagine synthase-related protein [Solirubrobacteraceae bacterium]